MRPKKLPFLSRTSWKARYNWLFLSSPMRISLQPHGRTQRAKINFDSVHKVGLLLFSKWRAMEFRTFKAGGRTFKAKVHTFIEKENLPATRFCRAVCVVLETDSLDHECFVGVALTFPGDVFSKKEGVIRATRTALRNAKHRNSN